MFKSIGDFFKGLFEKEPEEYIAKISKENQIELYKTLKLAEEVKEEQKRQAILAEKRAKKEAEIAKKKAEKQAKIDAKLAAKKAKEEAKAAAKKAKEAEKEVKKKKAA